MTDIVRRLRKVFAAGPTHGTFLDPVPDPLCNEAADEIERLQSLLEAANAYGAGENKARVEDRELLAQMMIRQSLATGHGDTVADLVRELEPQIERLRAEVAAKEKFVKDAIAACSNAGRLRELLLEARERELRFVLPLYRDANYLARIDAALGGEESK